MSAWSERLHIALSGVTYVECLCAVLLGWFVITKLFNVHHNFFMYCVEHFTCAKEGCSLRDTIDYAATVNLGDIDRNKHMNNAKYVDKTNFARRHFFVTLGIWPKMKRQGLNMIVRAQCIRYRRELSLWQSYIIRHKLLAIDDAEKSLYLEARFISNDFVCAIQYVKYTLVGKGKEKNPTVSSFLNSCGYDVSMVKDVPETIKAWESSNGLSSRELNPKKTVK
jgi:acyl-CoA thioesterase FadM